MNEFKLTLERRYATDSRIYVDSILDKASRIAAVDTGLV